MEGRGRMESGGKNEGPTTTKGERRKWIGGREGKRKGSAGPMSNCFLRPWCRLCVCQLNHGLEWVSEYAVRAIIPLQTVV